MNLISGFERKSIEISAVSFFVRSFVIPMELRREIRAQ